MKTGEEVKNRALQLLNYTDQDGRLDASMYTDILARSLALVNQIYGDLWYALHRVGFCELEALGETIDLPEALIHEAMPYGVAMLMAQTIGDGDNQAMMADLYNQKRAALTHWRRRRDVLPRAI